MNKANEFEPCIVCGDDASVVGDAGLAVCRGCAVSELPRLMAEAVLRDPLVPCAFDELEVTWAEAGTCFWRAAAHELHERGNGNIKKPVHHLHIFSN